MTGLAEPGSIPLCHFYSYHERMVHDQCRSTKKCVLSDRSDQITQTCHTSQWSDRSCSDRVVRTGLRSTGAAPMSFRSAVWRREIFSQSRRYVMQKFRQSLLEYFSPDSVRIRNDRISRTWINPPVSFLFLPRTDGARPVS